jgi:hypothetical protein
MKCIVQLKEARAALTSVAGTIEVETTDEVYADGWYTDSGGSLNLYKNNEESGKRHKVIRSYSRRVWTKVWAV